MSQPKSMVTRLRRAIGFTLVELLVVIGIISLLISILLPSLAKARDAAVNVQCMSQMRQIGLYVAMYASDNNGAFPMEYQVWGPTMKWVTWQDRLSQYDGRNLTDAEMDSWQIMGATGKDAKGLYVCPTQSQAASELAQYYYFTTYVSNMVDVVSTPAGGQGMYVNRVALPDGWMIPGKKLSLVKDSSNVIMLAEINYSGALNNGTPGGIRYGRQGYNENVKWGLCNQLFDSATFSNELGVRPHGGSGAGTKAMNVLFGSSPRTVNVRTAGKFNYLMVDGHVESLDPFETATKSTAVPPITASGMWVDAASKLH